ncbi:MAG: SAM-dependent methyltransferase [Candidatus Woesearchaeota archaeon]
MTCRKKCNFLEAKDLSFSLSLDLEDGLYIIATPIGNLEDISIRALKILANVEAIISEDTRETLKLLSHYKIRKPLFRGDEHSKVNYLKLFEKYKKIAFVSDRGCPNLSDPGSIIIKKYLEKYNDYSRIKLIPGATSLEVVSLLPFEGIPFVFVGFEKDNKKIENFLKNNVNVLLFESCHRINKRINELKKIECLEKIFVFHDITKMNEYVKILTNEHDENLIEKGEYVLFLKSKKDG